MALKLPLFDQLIIAEKKKKRINTHSLSINVSRIRLQVFMSCSDIRAFVYLRAKNVLYFLVVAFTKVLMVLTFTLFSNSLKCLPCVSAVLI